MPPPPFELSVAGSSAAAAAAAAARVTGDDTASSGSLVSTKQAKAVGLAVAGGIVGALLVHCLLGSHALDRMCTRKRA